jgi:hypothetical protein
MDIDEVSDIENGNDGSNKRLIDSEEESIRNRVKRMKK